MNNKKLKNSGSAGTASFEYEINGGYSGTASFEYEIDGGDAGTTSFEYEIDGGDAKTANRQRTASTLPPEPSGKQLPFVKRY